MVNPVHVWRYKEQAKKPIHREQQEYVCMIEHRGTVKDDLKSQNRFWRWGDKDNHS
ncbi:catenin [Desulfovibrio ferrophilus]|uniref:Catenin n=1 Tax=Desulfovibrio ferrophilus TaxID=241368 RepID=A0A2Z6AWZ7_9BACT|nr:catenin [Desulfovibrio ferrophilus]